MIRQSRRRRPAFKSSFEQLDQRALLSGVSYVSDLSSSFNRTGIVSDGSTFSGGLDGWGTALSSNLLGTSQTWNGTPFAIGAAGSSDVVSAAGQTISLPAGQYASLQFLATAVDGNQANQTFTVRYSDGTTATFTQSISDWYTPQGYSGESKAVTMGYRDLSNGTRDSRTFYVYGYSFSLDATKTVSSITLPNDGNVELLSATLSTAPTPTPTLPPSTAPPSTAPTPTPTLPSPISGTNYQLVWSDEFNGTSIDASKWNEVGPWGQPVSSTGNFSYLTSNVSEANGVATLTAQKSGSNWTGGILSTDTTKMFQYGFAEVRAKLPKGQGFWPAIWLYGGSSADELDMMESLGGDASTVYQTYHFPGGQHQDHPSSSDWTNDYHLFQMKWEPGRVTYYIDNVQMGSWTASVPARPMYLMLNFDVGGPNDWGGAPDGSTPSPATFNVDYVRVYQ